MSLRNRKMGNNAAIDLTTGSIQKGMVSFAIPLFFGQLLQQLYNIADAWVVGNFADNNAFAAVSSTGSITFLIIGFFGGIGTGGSVVISRYVGAKDNDMISKAIHTNFLLGIMASVISTVFGVLMTGNILRWMDTPAEVFPESSTYLGIYFAGVSTVIIYNVGMSILRALGDSFHPLIYLAVSSGTNVVLDLILVAVLDLGVMGAAVATVASQGLSAVLCVIKLSRLSKEHERLRLKKIRFYGPVMGEVIKQGLPMGIQNSVISIGNMVVQKNINSFGAYAMSGHGAYAKIEGFVFLPIMSMSMTLPTFISQNLGAKKYDRAKKGARIGIFAGMIMAEVIGVIFFLFASGALKFFVDEPEAIMYGTTQAETTSLFFFLLAFSHCAAGVLRGCGKSFIPMATMLTFWCGIRIVYVTQMLKVFPVFRTISWAYPLTWSCSTIVFLVVLLKTDWAHSWDKKQNVNK